MSQDTTTTVKPDVSSLLKDAGIDFGDELNLFAEDPSAFITPGRTFSLLKDEEVPFIGTIDGNPIECFATLKDARLVRMALIKQQPQGRDTHYYVANGSMRGVILDIDCVLGSERVPLSEVLRAIVNSGLPEEKKVNEDRFLTIASSFGLDFRGGMGLTWQHMGADHSAALDHLAEFKRTGAEDDIRSVRTANHNFEQILASQTGLSVIKMEVGSVDRTRSATGQGFVDFVDSIVTNFRRVVEGRKEIKAIEAWLEDNPKAAEEQIRAQKAMLDDLRSMTTSYAGTWSGARRRMQRQPDGQGGQILVPMNVIDPVNAPIGRMTVMVPKDDTLVPTEWSFWQTSANRQTAGAETEAQVDLTDRPNAEQAEAKGDEEPF